MAARKPAQKKIQQEKPARVVAPQETSSRWFDYLRFGESYTSLILGIIVVVITTILLVFTVKDRSVLPVTNGNLTQDVSSTKIEPTISVETTIGQIMETGTPIPTVPPTVAVPTLKPTIQPTAVASPTMTAQTKPSTQPTTIPSVAQKPTQSSGTAGSGPTAAQPQQNIGGQKSYTVAAGDTLWSIAEKFYKSGYNWVDVASANKVSNPGVITAGTKLVIPNVTPKVATIQGSDTTAFGPKITGSTYTVQKGDHLWGIAVRAYGDGFKWTEIAKLNSITSPSVINVGTVLKLPRTDASPAK
jgi:nucleoid-associated protein YgaU